MNINDLYSLLMEFKGEFREFKRNEFYHLKAKVDWLFFALISALLALIGNMILRLL